MNAAEETLECTRIAPAKAYRSDTSIEPDIIPLIIAGAKGQPRHAANPPRPSISCSSRELHCDREHTSTWAWHVAQNLYLYRGVRAGDQRLKEFHNCSIAEAVLSAFNPFKTEEQHSMGRCCKGVDRLSLFARLRSSAASVGLHGVMLMQALHCPYCHGPYIVSHGQTRQGKQQTVPHVILYGTYLPPGL